MSHAQGRALIAVSKGQEVGVDLERIRSDVEVAKLSERYFAPSEHATIMQSTQEQRAARFFRYWVAKEAVLKAQGVGLRALSQCEILLGADGVGAEVLVPAGSPLQDNWRVRLLSCGEGWEAAVAAQGSGLGRAVRFSRMLKSQPVLFIWLSPVFGLFCLSRANS